MPPRRGTFEGLGVLEGGRSNLRPRAESDGRGRPAAPRAGGGIDAPDVGVGSTTEVRIARVAIDHAQVKATWLLSIALFRCMWAEE